MKKGYIAILCFMALICSLCVTATHGEESESTGDKVKDTLKKVIEYPANVTEKAVGVIAETAKSGTDVVATEVKRVGEVVTGDVGKTKELIVEPLTGTAKTAKTAVEDTVKIPVEAAQE